MYALTVKRTLILVHDDTVNPPIGHWMPQKFKLQHNTTTVLQMKIKPANIGINHGPRYINLKSVE